MYQRSSFKLFFCTFTLTLSLLFAIPTTWSQENTKDKEKEFKQSLQKVMEKLPRPLQILAKDSLRIKWKRKGEKLQENLPLRLDYKKQKFSIAEEWWSNTDPVLREKIILKELAKVYFTHTPWSKYDQKQMKQLGLFFKHGQIFKSRSYINYNGTRKLNEAETKSPESFWAENVVEFFHNPTFPCRRPAVYHFMHQHFDVDPFPNQPCEPNFNVKIMSLEDLFTLKKSEVTIDPERVYQIHYLFASESSQPMSIVGHAMFRIVMCPEGVPVDEKCLEDANNDIVVSYRAHIEDLTINPFKGIFGGYPAKQFLIKMPDVVDEYNLREDRKMYSMPLDLTGKEKEAFIYKVLEQNAEYAGTYKFFSENCSTLAWGHLQCTTPNPLVQDKNILTPIGMFHQLNKDKMTDVNILKNRDESIRKGYYWAPLTEQIREHIKDLLTLDPNFPYKTPVEYMDAAVEEKRQVFDQMWKNIWNSEKDTREEKIRKGRLLILGFLEPESQLAKKIFYMRLEKLQRILVDGYRNGFQGSKDPEDAKKQFFDVFVKLKEYLNSQEDQCSKGYGIVQEEDYLAENSHTSHSSLDSQASPDQVTEGDPSKEEWVKDQAKIFFKLMPLLVGDLDQEWGKIAEFKNYLKSLNTKIKETQE